MLWGLSVNDVALPEGNRVPIPEAEVLEHLRDGSDLVVSLSGGGDSAAAYLHLLESGVFESVVKGGGRVVRVFSDTGWELPETYGYLDLLADRFGPIDRVALWVPGPDEAPPQGYAHLTPAWSTTKGADNGVMHPDRWAYAKQIEARLGRYCPLARLMFQWRKVPSVRRRWCTDDTKARPVVDFLSTLSNPVNAVGVRADESVKRGQLTAAEWSDSYDAYVWRPIFGLTKADVRQLHARHGLPPNPLYITGVGAGRVGCAPCVFSGAADIRWLAAHHPERLDVLADIETALEALGSPSVQKGGESPRWFKRWVKGELASFTVAEAVRLASDDLGGDAPLLFPAERAPGCAAWGLCSTG